MRTRDVALLRKTKKKIDDNLEIFFDSQKFQPLNDDPKAQIFRSDLKSYCLRGGKRIRGFLTILGFQMAGGNNDEGIIDVASAVELMHSAVLIHDDYIDNDTLRRGEDTFHREQEKKFSQNDQASRLRAITVGGDILAEASLRLLGDSSFDADLKVQSAKKLAEMAELTGIGEAYDIYHSFDVHTPQSTIEKILLLKTAKYTLSGPLSLGYMLGRGDDATRRELEAIGEEIGKAFQIQDDWLGLAGSESFDKNVASDLREGKPLYLLHLALEEFSDSEKAFVEKVFSKQQLTASEIKRLRTMLLSTKKAQSTQGIAKQYIESALEKIQKLPVPNEAKEQFAFIARFVVERKA